MSHGHLQNAIAPLMTLALRVGALGARFAIALYLIKVLPLAAVGQFGLISGAAGLLPAVIGLGLNFYLNREIISASPFDAGRKIRDRLIVTLLGLSLCLGLYELCAFWKALPFGALSVWALPVIALEVVFFDIHMALICLRRPTLANLLLLMRSALWVGPFIGLGLVYPDMRTLDVLLQMWLAALVMSGIVLGLAFRPWPWREIFAAQVDVDWLKSRVRTGWLIFLGDLGLAGFSFLDRFVIASLLGLSATGIYTFFWIMANAVQVLVAAAIIQVALPHLVEAFGQGEQSWRALMRRVLARTLAGSLVLAAAIFALVVVMLPFIGKRDMNGHEAFFVAVLVAVIIRALAEALQYGLYSRGQDRSFATVNIAGIAVNFISTWVALKLFGLWGAAVSMMMTSLFLLLARGLFLWRNMRATPLGQPEARP